MLSFDINPFSCSLDPVHVLPPPGPATEPFDEEGETDSESEEEEGEEEQETVLEPVNCSCTIGCPNIPKL